MGYRNPITDMNASERCRSQVDCNGTDPGRIPLVHWDRVRRRGATAFGGSGVPAAAADRIVLVVVLGHLRIQRGLRDILGQPRAKLRKSLASRQPSISR